MSFPVKAVVFDWAGTVIDFGCVAPVAALIEVFGEAGLTLSDAEARRDMGKAKLDHLRALLADADVGARWRDLKGREWAYMIPLVVMSLWIGVYPTPFINFIQKLKKNGEGNVYIRL